MPKPNQTPCATVAPRLELARRLGPDLLAEGRFVRELVLLVHQSW